MSAEQNETNGKAESSRPQFGGRFLVNEDDVFKHNAWDNVEWGEKQEQEALAAVARNSEVTLTEDGINRLELDAGKHWDQFYGVHQNKFFKNRNWLFTEFPELAPHLVDTFPIKINATTAAPDTTVQNTGMCQQDKNDASDQSLANGGALCEGTELTSDETGKRSPVTVSSTASGTVDISITGSLTASETASAIITETEPVFDTTASTTVIEIPSTTVPEAVSATSCSPASDLSVPEKDQPLNIFPGSSANYRILEMGCGVGNTIFPLLQTNNSEDLFVYGGDFSPTAIGIIKQHQEYDTNRCNVFVLDATSQDWSAPFPPNSLDVITCIYTLSAIHPDKHRHIAQQVFRYLKPGGVVLFRDYGRYDLAQLRFKKGKCLQDHFYARGDGTRCYFFTQEEIRDIFAGVGLKEKQNIVDRRLQVNRGKQLTMYRVWVQAKYTKPLLS